VQGLTLRRSASLPPRPRYCRLGQPQKRAAEHMLLLLPGGPIVPSQSCVMQQTRRGSRYECHAPSVTSSLWGNECPQDQLAEWRGWGVSAHQDNGHTGCDVRWVHKHTHTHTHTQPVPHSAQLPFGRRVCPIQTPDSNNEVTDCGRCFPHPPRPPNRVLESGTRAGQNGVRIGSRWRDRAELPCSYVGISQHKKPRPILKGQPKNPEGRLTRLEMVEMGVTRSLNQALAEICARQSAVGVR
jgi:hypothetical protein